MAEIHSLASDNEHEIAAGDEEQIAHAASILALGEGRASSDIITLTDIENDTQIVGFCYLDFFLDNQHGTHFGFPRFSKIHDFPRYSWKSWRFWKILEGFLGRSWILEILETG